MNSEEVAGILKNGDLEKQRLALRTVTKTMTTIAREAVNAMCNSNSPVVIAEDILLVVFTFKHTLEDCFSTVSSPELKSVASALLLQMGSKKGIDHLIETLRNGGDCDTLAAKSLARAGILEAIPALVERLEKFDPEFCSKSENAPKIHAFLLALETSGANLPAHLRARFTAPGVSRALSQFIN